MARMGKGERRSRSQQGSPFLKAPGLIFLEAAGPGLGRGVRARPSRSSGALTSRVPAIARRRLGDLPRAWHPTVPVTPGSPGLPPYPFPQRPDPPAPSALTARSGARARAAAAATLLGAPSPAQPRPRPRPTCCLSGSPTPSPWAPGSVSPHLADGKTESQQQRIPRAL